MPCTTASTVSPSRCASESRRIARTPQPSPGTKPLLPSSKAPPDSPLSKSFSRDSASNMVMSMCRCPAAQIIMSQAPVRSALMHAPIAISPDPTPASNASAPPFRSKVLVIREARVLLVKLPVSSSNAGIFERSNSSYWAIASSIRGGVNPCA